LLARRMRENVDARNKSGQGAERATPSERTPL